MKSFQFIIIVGTILVVWISLFITAISQDQRIDTIINSHTSTISTVEQNQKTNSNAIKDYISCLLNLNPAQTPIQIKAAEQLCFDNAPGVK